MKKFILLLLLLTFIFEVEGFSKSNNKSNNKRVAVSRGASSSKSNVRSMSGKNIRVANATAGNTSSSVSNTEQDPFFACMDNICKIDDNEKGRCRCSSQLARIEKVLRDIEEIQNQADQQNKIIETMMNVSNTALVSDAVGSVYDNINSIEKKSKTLASRNVDANLLVMEGLPLYEEALKQCEGKISALSSSDKKKKIQEYVKLVEADCSSYTTILKEKADNAQNLLVQSQKNQEMFEEQEYQKRNQLDVNACYIEYESCAKTECGVNFQYCKDSAKQEAVLKKCQAVNYGKCEDNKATVLLDVKKYIAKELEKVKLVDSCKASLGHLVNGKCLFKVRYVADKCGSGKKGCGSSDEKWANPGQSFVCDDKRGNFKELVAGCEESCYLIGPNDEKIYKGTNHTSNSGKKVGQVIGAVLSLGISLVAEFPGCKSDNELDRFTMPIPDGWGKDGYPVNQEFKGIL